MASTRSDESARRTAPSLHPGTPRQAFVSLVRHGARLQIAACTTAAATLMAWAETADRLAQDIGDELLRRVNGETDSAELVARIGAAGGAHLRGLTALRRAAANHFDARLERTSLDLREVR
jgi:hypothetical protein